MKNFLVLLVMITFTASCSHFDKWKTPVNGQSKASRQNKPAYIDPNAVSGPTTGHSYYLPESKPVMQKKTKSVKNTATKKPVKKSPAKKVL